MQHAVHTHVGTHLGSTLLPADAVLSSAPCIPFAASSPSSPAVLPLVAGPSSLLLLAEHVLVDRSRAAALLTAAADRRSEDAERENRSDMMAFLAEENRRKRGEEILCSPHTDEFARDEAEPKPPVKNKGFCKAFLHSRYPHILTHAETGCCSAMRSCVRRRPGSCCRPLPGSVLRTPRAAARRAP